MMTITPTRRTPQAERRSRRTEFAVESIEERLAPSPTLPLPPPHVPSMVASLTPPEPCARVAPAFAPPEPCINLAPSVEPPEPCVDLAPSLAPPDPC